METPSLALPCVNVGLRQAGRERALNIIDAEADSGAIIAAMQRASSAAFRDSLLGMSSPYGDGQAASTIARVLREVPLDDRLLRKRALPLRDTPYPAFQHGS
jgi:UDP-N-acetylglucosamine 2-epimerase